jgi:hypothetical protein
MIQPEWGAPTGGDSSIHAELLNSALFQFLLFFGRTAERSAHLCDLLPNLAAQTAKTELRVEHNMPNAHNCRLRRLFIGMPGMVPSDTREIGDDRTGSEVHQFLLVGEV